MNPDILNRANDAVMRVHGQSCMLQHGAGIALTGVLERIPEDLPRGNGRAATAQYQLLMRTADLAGICVVTGDCIAVDDVQYSVVAPPEVGIQGMTILHLKRRSA